MDGYQQFLHIVYARFCRSHQLDQRMAPTKSLKAAVKYSVKAIARKPKGGPPRREWSRAWLIFRLKLAQNRNALLVTLAFWALGFAYYWQAEGPAAGGRHVLLVSLGVREPLSRTDVSGFYQMTWPIFLEVIFFGFILAAFVERYSPVRLGRIQARRLAEHTVVVGYGHLGQRMVDHLQHAGKPFVVVDRTEATVGDLLSAEEAVVLVRQRHWWSRWQIWNLRAAISVHAGARGGS